MKCFHCENSIDLPTKHLKCGECLSYFHLKCLPNIADKDYEFLISSNVLWKCDTCKKSTKFDDKPITPVRDQPYLSLGTESPKNCKSCNKGFSYNSHRALCRTCKAVFHFKCLGMTKDQFMGKYRKNNEFVCEDCSFQPDLSQQKITAEEGGRDKAPAASQLMTMSKDQTSPSGDVMVLLQEMRSFRNEVANTHRDLKENMAKHSDWVEEINIKLDGVIKQVTDFTNEMGLIRQENLNLKKQVSDLNMKVDHMEQLSKDKVVEIHGVPYVQKENLLEIIAKISKEIRFEFNDGMVDNCYRYGSNAATANRPTGIVVRFVRKLDMELFMEKRREKRNLNSRHLGFMEGEATPVYINNSLTQERRKLLNAARKVKIEKLYTYLWVRNGRIFMRKNQGDRYVNIDAYEDLQRLT